MTEKMNSSLAEESQTQTEPASTSTQQQTVAFQDPAVTPQQITHQSSKAESSSPQTSSPVKRFSFWRAGSGRRRSGEASRRTSTETAKTKEAATSPTTPVNPAPTSLLPPRSPLTAESAPNLSNRTPSLQIDTSADSRPGSAGSGLALESAGTPKSATSLENGGSRTSLAGSQKKKKRSRRWGKGGSTSASVDSLAGDASPQKSGKQGFISNLSARIKATSQILAKLSPTRSRSTSPTATNVGDAVSEPDLTNPRSPKTRRHQKSKSDGRACISIVTTALKSGSPPNQRPSTAGPRLGPRSGSKSNRGSATSLHVSIPSNQLLTPNQRPMSGPPHLGSSQTCLTPEVTETSEIVREVNPETGHKMVNQYMIMKELGRGCHGKVKLTMDTTTGEYWAMKMVDKSTRRRFGAKSTAPTNLDKVRREIAILKKCVHPNVVRLKEVIDAPDAKKIYLVLEYVDGGEIQWKRPYREQPAISIQDAKRVFRDVVLGLEYLHFQGIIHRDIKPANLLWSQSKTVKISDFGVSFISKRFAFRANSSASFNSTNPLVVASNNGSNESLKGDSGAAVSARLSQSAERLNSAESLGNNSTELVPTSDAAENDEDALELAKTAGSPAFFAPELCAVEDDFMTADMPEPNEMIPKSEPIVNPISQPITKAIDLWALGVTLYCLIYGRCPFMADTEFELFSIIPRFPVFFPKDAFTDDQAFSGSLELHTEVNKDVAVAEKAAEVMPYCSYQDREEQEIKNLSSTEDRENGGLGLVDDELKDLLLKLLEKDATKRIKLEDVKRHPWVISDLENPAEWYTSTDPANFMAVEVTEAEVKDAVTVMSRIRNTIRKLSISLSNLTRGGIRRRTKSFPTPLAATELSAPVASTDVSAPLVGIEISTPVAGNELPAPVAVG